MTDGVRVLIDDRGDQSIAVTLADVGGGDAAGGFVLIATETGDWSAARQTLGAAYTSSQAAARQSSPVVYVVHIDDLLGRRGAPSAMMATGLLSAARTLAVEGSRRRVPVNVLAIEDDTDAADAARWIVRLLEPGGPIGELVRLGPSHLGKTLP